MAAFNRTITGTIAIIMIMGGLAATRIPGPSRMETFYRERSDIEPLDLHSIDMRDPAQCYQAFVGRQSPKDGSGLVIVRDRIDDPRRFVLDDEVFDLLSIALPTDLVPGRIELPSSRVDIAWSRGGVHWLWRCEGQLGANPRGTMETTKLDDGTLDVSLDLTLDMVDPRALEPTVAIRLREVFIAKLLPAGKGMNLVVPASMNQLMGSPPPLPDPTT